MIDTLGNTDWLKANEDAISNMLPETWTHIENLNGLKIGFQLKLLGFDWRSEEQLSKIMVFLERVGIMQREGYTVRRNPNSIFEFTVMPG